jgi:hypothetical protein
MIKRVPRQLAETLYRGWSASFDLMWSSANGVTPADRVAALGTNAAELFAANAALTTLMLGMIGESDPDMKAGIESRLASLPAYTVNQDGTVTLS